MYYGNSSSAMRSVLGVPAVNIGSRQQFREEKNIMNVTTTAQKSLKQLKNNYQRKNINHHFYTEKVMQLKNGKNHIKNKRKYTKKIILQMSTISKQKLEDHEKYLKKDLFFTENKWPQFNLLFEDIKKLSRNPIKIKSCFLERNLLYGGYSLFAPFF